MSTKARRITSRSAMTLVELVIATGISAVIMIAVMTLSFYTSRSFAAMSNYTTLDQQGQFALDRLTRVIRQANAVADYSATNVTLDLSPLPPVTFAYDRDSEQLLEISQSNVRVLLDKCDSLRFDLYQRNTQAGTFNQFPYVTTTNTAKIIQVSWNCYREILGSKANTESIQSAKIVLRK